MTSTQVNETRVSRVAMPRTRGAASGVLLVLLGIWGAIVPFVGPYFDFAYSPDSAWTWTAARGWYDVLPGAVAAAAGLVMLLAANRALVAAGSVLAIAAGGWLVIGPQLVGTLGLGSIGVPTATSAGMSALEALAYFYALGALIVALGAMTLGRTSMPGIAFSRVEQRAASYDRPTAPGEDGPEPESARASARDAIAREQNDHTHRHFLHSRRAERPAEESESAGSGASAR